jgi:dihydrofolate reductase
MAILTYSMIASLDGFVSDEAGDFGWAAPDAEVHAFVNELERPAGTYLYGRRMYEVMRSWEDLPDLAAQPPAVRDYAAIWRAADKVVFSRTLPEVITSRTRLERAFDPEHVRALKASAARDLTVGGPDLAGQALAAGLVDELCLLVVPAIVGGGTRWLPDGVRLDLALLDARRFAGGTAYLRYRVRT